MIDKREVDAKNPPSPLIGLTGKGDETDALENIMAFAKSNGYTKVLLPRGTFAIRYLNYRDGIDIEGTGINSTFLKALPSTEPVFVKSVDSPTQQFIISKFTIDGDNINKRQHGLGLIAYPLSASPYHGGVWYSYFKDLRIRKFKGSQIIVKKGAKEIVPSSLPNQFNVFENVHAYRTSDPTSFCLYMEDQIGQHTIRNCSFDGPVNGVKTKGTNIYINGGNTILFDMVTSQNSEKAVEIKNNKNTTFRNCWFENIKYCITTYRVVNFIAESVNFANACADGTGKGYGIKSLDSIDSIVVNSCNFAGDVDYSVWGNSESRDIKMWDLKGVVKIKDTIVNREAVDGVDLGNVKIMYLTNRDNTVNVINHNVSNGEMLTVKFHGAGTTTITNSGNIILPNGVNSIVFNSGDCAIFMPTTLENRVLLIAHNKITNTK